MECSGVYAWFEFLACKLAAKGVSDSVLNHYFDCILVFAFQKGVIIVCVEHFELLHLDGHRFHDRVAHHIQHMLLSRHVCVS